MLFKIGKFILPIIACLACSTPDYSDYKDDNLSVKFSRESWIKVDPNKADIAYQSQSDGSIISLNSFCRKYQNESLDSLSMRALSGIRALKLLKQQTREFSGREAYELEATGELDGVKVGIKLLNFRKNNCYYDLFLLTPKNLKPEGLSAFDQFTQEIQMENK